MALKQLIKTQMKWRKKTQKWVEIETATKIRANVIEKKKKKQTETVAFFSINTREDGFSHRYPKLTSEYRCCVTEILETLDSRTRPTEST